MAATTRRTRMAANGGNGHRTHTLNHDLLRDEASQITDAVARIVAMTDQVSAGADVQVQSLDSALSGLNQMTASLKETAGQAESVASSTDSLTSSITEVAASIEQVTKSTNGLAADMRSTASAVQEST